MTDKAAFLRRLAAARRRPFRAAVLLAAALALWLAAPLAALAQTPFVPESWQYGRRVDEGALTYCVDPRDPEWPVAGDIAEAIAGALLLRPNPHTVEAGMVTAGFDSLYRYFLEDCDLYLGFKLIPNAYPDWLALTRPYYQASYVLVVTDPDWESLADMPRTQPIGSTIGTTADLRLIEYLRAVPADRRWPRFPMASNEAAIQALVDGTIGAALVWQPALWALRQADPALADLRIIPSDPLPVSTVGVGAALLANQTFLRSSVDQAIAALAADGTIQRILEEHDFPATPVP